MQQPAVIPFDVGAFRKLFPAFANQIDFDTCTVQTFWNVAAEYISPVNYGWMQGASRALAINQMTAHLLALQQQIADGQIPGMETSASIDKIAVTLEPPPVQSQFQWWLSLTPYGQQLLALLSVKAAGGWGVGGSFTRAGFRGNGVPLY